MGRIALTFYVEKTIQLFKDQLTGIWEGMMPCEIEGDGLVPNEMREVGVRFDFGNPIVDFGNPIVANGYAKSTINQVAQVSFQVFNVEDGWFTKGWETKVAPLGQQVIRLNNNPKTIFGLRAADYQFTMTGIDTGVLELLPGIDQVPEVLSDDILGAASAVAASGLLISNRAGVAGYSRSRFKAGRNVVVTQYSDTKLGDPFVPKKN